MNSAMSVERPLADLGTKLREARQRKGMTLRQIANTTKIAIAVLDGLERNDISKLPGGIFGRAFVRSFAHEVGLDPEASIREFMEQFRDDSVAAGHPRSERIVDKESLGRKRRIAGTFLALIALIVLVVAIIVYFGFAGGREASVAAARPAPAEGAAVENAAPRPSRDPPAPEVAPSQPASDKASAAAGANLRPAPDGPVTDRLVVSLAVTRPCWVSATVDGQKQIEQVLRPGDERSLEVRRELGLTVGDAGAVTMTLNGVPAKALGKGGEVVATRLNLTNFKTYLQAQ
jgi:cytoskeleton protein RodZ